MALQLWQEVVKAAPERLVLIQQMLQIFRPVVDARVNPNMYPEYYDAFSIAPMYNTLITEMSGRQSLPAGSDAGAVDLQSAYAGVHEFWFAIREYYTGKNAESCDATEALRIQELMHAFTEEIPEEIPEEVPPVIPEP